MLTWLHIKYHAHCGAASSNCVDLVHMGRQGFSQVPIVAVIFILILIGGAYYLGTLKSTSTVSTTVFQSNISPTAIPTDTPTGVPDYCLTEKDNILSVVATFESLQQSKKPSEVLQLFTPPQLQQDVRDYQNLSGADAQISPRLYNNVSTNYNTLSYKVLQAPTKNSDNNCGVSLEEQRSNYGGPTNPTYLPPTAEDFTLVFTRQNNAWKISQYQSQRSDIRKGEFSGFLMEFVQN